MLIITKNRKHSYIAALTHKNWWGEKYGRYFVGERFTLEKIIRCRSVKSFRQLPGALSS